MLGIVIPAYKRKDCLREALESLAIQTMKRFFVIVVDDHSPEPLEGVVNEFADKLHIKYIYAEENGGPGAARQIGLEACYKAGFDLVMFMDSDDLLYPHTVARLTYEINHTSYDIISSGVWVEKKNSTGAPISADNKTWLHGKIYRTKHLQENGIQFPPIRANEDLSFNLKAMLSTKKVGLIDENLWLFRDEKNSITRCGENDTEVGGTGYIEAIYYSAKYFNELGEEVPIGIVINILNCYNYCQNLNSIDFPVPKNIKEKMGWLLNLSETQKILKNKTWLNEHSDVFKHYQIKNKQIYYYPQTFKDWLEEYTDGNSNN